MTIEMGLLESELALSLDGSKLMSRATIRKFVVAWQFIEVLRCFENGMTEEVSYASDVNVIS